MMSETFEQVLASAQAGGSLNPAWKKFVHTKFFVAVVPAAPGEGKKAAFHLSSHDGAPAVLISEARERLAPAAGQGTASLTGADIIRLIQAEAGIAVALSDRVFAIARDRVEWLRAGIEASQARAAAKAREAAGQTVTPPPAPASGFPTLFAQTEAAAPARPPAPAPVSVPAAAPAAAPLSLEKPATPKPRNAGVLDVAALRPRNVGIDTLGLQFFVPGNWRHSLTPRSLKFGDPEGVTRCEASAYQRALPLAQWVEMRLALVAHEMRYLTQDGPSYKLEGDDWRARVQGMATEFTGTFPGDDRPSRYLVACIRSEDTAVVITIRAPEAVFDEQRLLYRWLLSKVDLVQPLAAATPAVAAAGAAGPVYLSDEAPPLFGMSLSGRIGRARALAYSIPTVTPFMLLAMLAATIAPTSMALGLGLGLLSLIAILWFSLRLMVLRMHDVNLSGKWILGFIAFCVLASIFRQPVLLAVVSVLFWLGVLVIYYLVPGNDGDNDYGPPPPPNTPLITAGAVVFALMQVLMVVGQVKAMMSGAAGLAELQQAMQGRGGRAQQEASAAYSPPDKGFSVSVPGTMRETPIPAEVRAMMRGVKLHQYELHTGERYYMVQAITYDYAPDRFAAIDRLQNAAIRGGTLLQSRPVATSGFSGREIRIGMQDGSVRVARVLVSGKKEFTLMIAAPGEGADDPAIDEFFNSFQASP